jgi:hypothetical protein
MGFILSDDTEDSPTTIFDDNNPTLMRRQPSSPISPTSPSPLLRRARRLRQDRLRFPVSESSSHLEEESGVEEQKPPFIPYRRRMFGRESPPPSQGVAEAKSSLVEDGLSQQEIPVFEDSAVAEESQSNAWSDVTVGNLRERRRKRD